jgi:hypothetical protein
VSGDGRALLPLTAVTTYLILARPLGARTALGTILAPRHLLTVALVASPWYGYVSWTFPVQLRSQFAQEAADNLGPGVAAMFGHLTFYFGTLVVYQLPAVFLTVRAWWRNRQQGLCPPRLRPLAWYVAVNLAVFVFLFAHHRDRYLLLVVPTLSLLMAHVIHQRGVTRTARRAAAIAAIAQIVAVGMHSYIVGRPLHDLVRDWEQNPRGDLAASALADRETTWALAIAGGRLVPYRDGTPYVLASAEQLDRFPSYKVVNRAARAWKLVMADGRLTVTKQEFVLLRLRAPAGTDKAPPAPDTGATVATPIPSGTR